MRLGRQRLSGVADRLPLFRAGGALHQLIVMVEQHVEIGHVEVIGVGVEAPSMPEVMV